MVTTLGTTYGYGTLFIIPYSGKAGSGLDDCTTTAWLRKDHMEYERGRPKAVSSSGFNV